MDWVKLAQRYYLDPAIRGMDGDLADAAEVMFTRGLARAGEVGQHGFIPEQDVPLLARRRRYAAVVRVLTESGLWQAVPGGYQVRRWADWQDHLDALTRKRTADRERQRARRAAAGRDRPGSNPSRDPSRDVTAVEGEGEGDLEGVQGGDTGTARPSTDERPPVDNPEDQPPPWRCPRHAARPADGNCGPCGDYRRTRQDWDRQRAEQAAARSRDGWRCTRCAGRQPPDSATCRQCGTPKGAP